MTRSNWTKEESILVLALYCKIPFGKINKTNPLICQLAQQIGRTPSAVAMKMCNFGRFDPELQARGVRGLANGSKLDKKIWDEFSQNMEALFSTAEQALQGGNNLFVEESDLPVGESVPVISTVRKGQAYFRNTVLSAYNNTCCLTGINIKPLLQASHIKSWIDSDPKTERTNPTNGLCLNVLHHKAFDEGIITIDNDLRILISKTAKDRCTKEVFREYFLRYEGKKIDLPSRFYPCLQFIEYHNSKLSGF